jgi:hypothetical protein
MALVTKNFSDIITFTRASTATFFNSAGVLTSAAVDAPRFDFNPSTLAAQGLLVEESRTNLLSYSDDFGNAAWTKGGATVSTDTTTAPTGTTVADSLIEDSSTGTHRCYRTTTGTTNTNAYTFSAFIKANTRSRVYMAIVEGATFSRQGNANFDLSAGNVISFSTGLNGATGGAATITPIGNGWYRCTYTITLGGTDTSILTDFQLINTGTNRNYTGNGTSGLFIWGAQLEAGAFPTSYIPTTTTALTRAVDLASVNTLSPWFNASTGTIYAEFLRNTTPAASTFPQFVNIDDGTVNNRLAVSTNSSRNLRGQVAIGGTFTTISTANAYTEGVVSKLALGYQALNHAAVANGGTAATDTTVNVPSGLTTMRLGDQSGGAGNVNGYLRRITYYPRRLSNAELQAITV